MTFQLFQRIFPFLLVVSVCILFYVLKWGDITQNISFHFHSTSDSEEGKYIGRDGLAIDEMSVLAGPKDNHTSYLPLNMANKTVVDPIKPDPAKLKSGWSEFWQDTLLTDITFMKGNTTQGPVSPYRETPMPILHKRDYDKLPHWDFDDVYIQDAQPRQATCPQSLHSSEDPSFKQAFAPNIRLFMYKEHLNINEWNRLSHFNNPFGFMGYYYTDVKAAVDLIPKPKEPLLLPRGPDGCVRCAVVGTGGILNGSGMGKEIDAHDYVFRMNGAVTQGYEEDVGNRTTVYVHTAHSITASLMIFREYGFKNIPHDEGIKYVMIPEGMRDFQWMQGLLNKSRVSTGPYRGQRPLNYYMGQFDENRFYVLHPDFLRYVRNRFLKSPGLNHRYWAIVRPTNGAFTIFLALHTCDVVDAYGFITEDWSKYPNYYAERLVKTKVIFYANHDYNMEMRTWKNLHDAKIIKLYQRKDSEKETDKPEQH